MDGFIWILVRVRPSVKPDHILLTVVCSSSPSDHKESGFGTETYFFYFLGSKRPSYMLIGWPDGGMKTLLLTQTAIWARVDGKFYALQSSPVLSSYGLSLWRSPLVSTADFDPDVPEWQVLELHSLAKRMSDLTTCNLSNTALSQSHMFRWSNCHLQSKLFG